MTPAEHYAAAEAQLDMAANIWATGNTKGTLQDAVEALAHAVLAIAGELGVPHATTTPGGNGAPQTTR